MKTHLAVGPLLAGSFFLFWSASACAQFQYIRPPTTPYPMPPVSPYINLFRGGNPPLNYFGLVRPQQQLLSSMQQLRQANLSQSYAASPEVTSLVPDTGHVSQFMNFSHYYGGARLTNPATLRPSTTPPALSPLATVPAVTSGYFGHR